MYIRPAHREEDASKILEFIRQNDFATLVSYDGEKPVATHLLFSAEQTETGEIYLEGHIARANQQWKTFDESKEVLAIFLGAHSYISPTWYEKPNESVPTWNYISAHVYGIPRIIEDESRLFDLLKKLVDKYEAGSDYKLENISPDYVGKLIKGIVGFRIDVTRIEASYKLAQTLDSHSYENVIVNLEKSENQNSKRIAEAMRDKQK